MSRFHYHEAWKSRIRCARRRYQILIFLYKQKRLRSDDPQRRSVYQNRIADIKKYQKCRDYPKEFDREKKQKVVVYTCIFGDYDRIKPIQSKSKLCDYRIITDQPVPAGCGWTPMNVSFPQEIRDASAAIKNRYCKMHPHILFPEYEFSIYLDGSMIVYADIFPLLGRLGDHFLGMYRHGVRDCIYEEAETVLRVGKAPADIAEKQMQRYRAEGFPEHYGLTEGGIIVRKHNDERCVRIMEEWWQIFMSYSKRDQLGLMYVLWKNGMSFGDIALLGSSYEDDPRLKSEGHR